jgi:nicotinamidase-related amidase
MPAQNPDLHGNVPEQCSVALLLIDVINDLEFPEGDQILPFALKMARCAAALKKRTASAGIPAVYVNDNFGRWRSDFHVQVDHCLTDVRGKPLAELLRPSEHDYFVLKPKHSGFFSTTLEILLAYLEVEILILTGLTANNCVLFTANDAYMRDYRLIVPSDCVASVSEVDTQNGLQQMRDVLKADTRPSSELAIEELLCSHAAD